MGSCRVYRSETRTRLLLTWGLRGRGRNGNDRRALVAAVVAALLFPAAALAHVNVQPTLVVTGKETVLRIELPELQPGRRPTALDVAGPGVSQLSSAPSGLLGLESRFRVRVRIETEPGPLPLLLLARYDDGQTVRIRQTLTVVPPEAGADSGAKVPLWAGILAGGLLATGATLAFLNFKKKSRTAW